MIGEFDNQYPSPGGDAAAFPCTLLQERLWTRHRVHGPQGLNIAMRWLVRGNLSHATAESALQTLIRRYEILRTSFRETDAGLAQIVWPACPIKLNDIDLTVLAPDEREQRAEEIARAEAMEPIDPTKPPLLRASLLRLAPDRGVLLLTLHSMVADGWSTGILIREFRTTARAIEAGRMPDLPEPELQFVDYALWQKELLSSGDLDEARTYWMHRLKGAVATAIPADRRTISGSWTDEQDHLVSLLMSNELGQAIESFARRRGVTLFSVAAASLALMLHRLTGESEVVFGSQVANREEPAAADLVGPTVNSVTFRLSIHDSATLHDYVSAAADQIQEALRHERLPFEIAEAFAEDRGGRPLHAVNLVLHRSYSGTTDTQPDDGGRFDLVSLPSYSSGALWPLNFFMIRRDEGWRISCEADASLFEKTTAKALLGAWQAGLEALATAPDGPLSDCAAVRAIAAHTEASLQAPAVQPGRSIPLRSPARQIVRFHEHGTLTPITVLNNRSIYYQLARKLGEDRPFTDILMYHQDGPIDLDAFSFEEFADYAVRLIRFVQPRGPYILGGHCVYGVLACEAARLLRRMGEEIRLVALFDSWAPGYRETMSRLDRALRAQQLRFDHYKNRLRQFSRGELSLDDITRKPLLYRLGLLPPAPGPTRQPLPGEWFDGYLYDKVTRFRPPPYEGDVVLFRTDEPLRGRLFDERMGWGPLVTGKLTKVDIHSGHFDMFRERPAAEIAAFLRSL